MLDFSVFLAGIRPQNWLALYESIKVSTQREFELIFVGPHGLPDEMKDLPNVKFVQDYGCPTRCFQIGMSECSAPYAVWGADDGVFLNNGAIDKAFDVLSALPPSKKNLISFKYYEGDDVLNRAIHKGSDYWRLGYHQYYMDFGTIPSHYLLLMTALVDREYMLEIGGWDCRFKHLGMGANDLAIRIQRDGANVILGEAFMVISHISGPIGDHVPIHDSHVQEDMPLFASIYSDPNVVNRTKIDFDNWKESPEVWDRRFPEGKPNA